MRTNTLAIAAAALLAGTATAAYAQDVATNPTAAATVDKIDAGQVVTMQDAIAVAMQSNPQIIQAQMNTEAIQFERRQAQGLYAPRVDIEASGGIRRLENTTRRNLGIANDVLYPLEAGITGSWTAIDFGRRRGEVLKQAARVDGASLRVVERSEFVALQVARQYLNVLLQQRVVAASMDNVSFHQTLVGDLGKGVQEGSISIADQQQAEERLQAALVQEAQAEQDLENAKITLRALTGLNIDNVAVPPDLAASLPSDLDTAVGLARTRNPLVRESQADVDSANAAVDKAVAEQYPTIGVEVRGRVGEDIDGFAGETNDVQALAVLRWNVFDGGIAANNVQEMVRRASEQRYILHQRMREAEQDVRTAWLTMNSERDIAGKLARQSEVGDDLLLSYRSQFNVGRRSLLDVLDAQNTRYNTQVRLETAKFSQLFAQYQTLAATNNFIDSMNIAPGAGAGMTERVDHGFGPPVPAELQRRFKPKG
ncbi:TolC family protein [Tsuneonella mangrovi]|uniref:TolC family protein n=1 Tax=Tsuneonella mangrovi TaxID=1982042 RepID=UPI000BA256F1|nr:TolC family protein [Tsuneonella mangrovi]